ncbi:MAG: aminoacyl-tRNA hydrolase [Arenibacter algicola]|uniref:Peptidyl-tRNA hydrolase ArfB n=1 Tax=Arenibacter algicola TaxID=616991 RepID=A0A221UTQ0_9FLAO|nr:alternative ribosome rescue aminoacyl-tRNA hydrolase ArfB [Arenibacter algicola]ASO04692.1 peptidyl-tRNA hydrolase ArfB [Arenibacter algicola]MBD3661743.1 aminoacyl-tRNA hydrolase [Arenibacter algicola]MDX1758519.1 alternative ribosome rescue aminoacyl-tRNA hydrolase ArfB [Arenibacter algicola]
MNREGIIQELKFKAVRSSGAGGQHVNKVSSKVELTFDLENSMALTDLEKNRLLKKLSSKLSKENILLMQCEETRSQHKNKELVIKKFLETLEANLVVPKRRRKTKPTRSAIEKRLKSKKKAALKKLNRGKPRLD